MTKIETVLAALDKRVNDAIDESQWRNESEHIDAGEPIAETATDADAAKLIRALAADFEKYCGMHRHAGCGVLDDERCLCGLNAAMSRWRLPR